MILGSAPEYPHGTIDPIEAFGELALKHGIPLHVDACVGGFILPFMAMNGRKLPLWDYRVPGVTSISADIHKYGFASKGASTITYRNLDFLKHQMFVYQDWPGGVFASPALLGTRPGGAYAAAWAAMQHMGKSGYRDLARRTCKAFDQMRKGIAQIPGLYVMGEPSGPLLGYGSNDPDVNIYAVGDQMDAKGWQINRLQNPDGLHAMITAQHLDVMDDYLRDLKESVATVKAHPELAQAGSAATYGMMSHIPLRGMVKNRVLEMFAGMYKAGGAEVDLHAASGPGAAGGGHPGTLDALVERLATLSASSSLRVPQRGLEGDHGPHGFSRQHAGVDVQRIEHAKQVADEEVKGDGGCAVPRGARAAMIVGDRSPRLAQPLEWRGPQLSASHPAAVCDDRSA